VDGRSQLLEVAPDRHAYPLTGMSGRGEGFRGAATAAARLGTGNRLNIGLVPPSEVGARTSGFWDKSGREGSALRMAQAGSHESVHEKHR